MARHSHYNDLLKHAYSAEFAAWEQQALAPKDVLRYPKQLHSRARVAELMRDLRAGRVPALDPETVLEELRGLVLDQTKSVNCHQAYSPAELETIQANCQAEYSLTRLLLWLRNVRRVTQARYDAELAAQHEQQGFSWPASSHDLAA